MSEATQASTSTPAQPAITPLVRHTKKQEWGRALLLWRREEKRAYQFEDGSMRVFAERFCGMLQPALHPDPVLRARLQEQAVAGGHVGVVAGTSKNKTPRGPTPTVADQVSVFGTLFEGGFAGTAWRNACRASGTKKVLKRHVDPAVERAQAELSVDALRAHVDAGNPKAVVDTILSIVGSTSLATKTQLSAIAALDVDAALGGAFIDFLHDVGGAARGPLDRLRIELARLGLKKVPWTVLTAAKALLHPETHLFVRPTALREQAKLLMPGFKLSTVPTPDAYARCLEMAVGIRNELRAAGLAPRDLLDVAEFMRVTLSKSQRDELLGAMAERSRPKTAAAVH
ncbi:MAG: hypothetical protein ACRBN8_01615 [Nannocystales bacterium]